MKKSKLAGVLLCSLCLIAGSAAPAMADSVKVVTLGADLTEEQKETMLRYFKVDRNDVQILTITNQDERDHLSAYVPLEQIGTRTVSSAYVKPTQSGGIKVRTANLNWVTCNMIATTLSTSGVKNCEVVAACPFEVSGTGALTGIQMAYETATGEQLDETKKQIATEEMVVTGNLADEVGKNDATIVINKAKMIVIQNGVEDEDSIYDIVIDVANENGVSLSEDQISEIVDLLVKIAQQDYNYEDMAATLEMVDGNVSGDDVGELEDEDDVTVDAGEIVDSIVDDLDDSILGDDVVASSTEDPGLEQETGMVEGTAPEDEWTEDDWTADAVVGEGDASAADEVAEFDTSSLTEDQMYLFNQADTFFTGEYSGDADALWTVMGEDADAPVLDEKTADALTKKVKKLYLDILVNGTDSYSADGTEMYMTTELNMLDKGLKEIFGQDETAKAIDALADVTEEDKVTLYKDTMKFFEKLYGETTSTDEDYSEDYSGDYSEEDTDAEGEMEYAEEEYAE